VPLNCVIDVLAAFDGRLLLCGWVVGVQPIVRLELCSSCLWKNGLQRR
jgi:hypothetical protein